MNKVSISQLCILIRHSRNRINHTQITLRPKSASAARQFDPNAFLNSHGEELPRITIPTRMVDKLQKAKQQAFTKKIRYSDMKRKPVIISCKRRSFNHYMGQTYEKLEPSQLACGGWKHKKSKGDYFTINAFKPNPAWNKSSLSSFRELDLNPILIKEVHRQNIHKPTEIQVQTVPELLAGNSVLCTAQTGCGKTLAYLLPLLHMLIAEQKEIDNRLRNPLYRSPRAILLVPSRELVNQLYEIISKLIVRTSLKIRALGSARSIHSEDSFIDLLIGTPGVVRRVIAAKSYDFGFVRWLVLDEVDTLLDDTFAPLIRGICHALKISGHNVSPDYVDASQSLMKLHPETAGASPGFNFDGEDENAEFYIPDIDDDSTVVSSDRNLTYLGPSDKFTECEDCLSVDLDTDEIDDVSCEQDFTYLGLSNRYMKSQDNENIDHHDTEDLVEPEESPVLNHEAHEDSDFDEIEEFHSPEPGKYQHKNSEKSLLNRSEKLSETVPSSEVLTLSDSAKEIFLQLKDIHLGINRSDASLDDIINEPVGGEASAELMRERMTKSMKKVQSDLTLEAGLQAILVGATIPRALQQQIGEFIPMDSLVRISTSQIHRILGHISQKFIRIHGLLKPERLLSYCKPPQSPPALIFCKNGATAVFVEKMLTDNGVYCLPLHSLVSLQERCRNFAKFQDGSCDFLVCTDLASRGLDTQRAERVINYNFPSFVSDYIHRCGRVGRVGSSRSGHVISFISYKWEVDLLMVIELIQRKRYS